MTNSAPEPFPVGHETAINADDAEQESIESSWTLEELAEQEIEDGEGVREQADLPDEIDD